MNTHTMLLRSGRRQSQLSQYDIAFLLNLKNHSAVSRCEKGERQPSMELILTYHLLFDIPLSSLLTPMKSAVKQALSKRIQPLLDILHKYEPTSRTQARIEYLEKVLLKLNLETAYGEK